MNAPAFRDYDAEMAEERRRNSLRNVDVEQAFLGCLLTWNHVLAATDGQLEPQHFSEGIHARIFEASASLIREGRQASAITLRTYFARDDTLLQIGGMEYLARLAGSATAPQSAAGYARLIRELAMRRAAVRLAERAIDGLYELPVDLPPETFVAGLAAEFSGLAGGGTGEQTRFDAEALTTLAIDATAAAHQGGGDPDAIASGLKVLDAKTSLCRGNLTIVGARPSMGKSALALSLCANVAKRGEPAVLISLEMRAKQLGHRLLSMATAQAGRGMIGYSRMGAGRITEPEFGHIVDIAKEQVSRWPLTIEDRSSMTVVMISAVISQIKQKQPRLALVVVDYLGLVTAGDRYRGRKVDEVGEICAGLKEIAKRANVCLVALHQLSRANESRENKRPMLSDLRDAGNVEQDADVVIFPYREAYYLARALEAAEPGSSEALKLTDDLRTVHDAMELIVAKNRHGPIGTVKVRVDMATNLITDFDADAGQGVFL